MAPDLGYSSGKQQHIIQIRDARKNASLRMRDGDMETRQGYVRQFCSIPANKYYTNMEDYATKLTHKIRGQVTNGTTI